MFSSGGSCWSHCVGEWVWWQSIVEFSDPNANEDSNANGLSY
jgi:hypothetical protein